MAVAIDLQTKTEVLLEALPYIQQFAGAVFVVKFGGSFLDSEVARESVTRDLVFLAQVGIRVVVVHGGGPAINQAMAAANLQPEFRNGLRVTDAATIQIVEQTLNQTINAEVVQRLRRIGGKARGIYGQMVFWAERQTTDAQGQPVDLGFVGRVQRVERELLEAQLLAGYLPVISPVARDAAGQYYNVNADVAAAEVAAALGARRLIYLCDVPGLLRHPPDPATLISTLPVAEVPGLIAAGVIGRGMAPKVESAVRALDAGVRRVHFIDGRLPHSLLLEMFTDQGVGTEIIHPHAEGSA